MAQAPPPTEQLPIFDASQFVHDTTGLTRTQADNLYCHYPNVQGHVNVPTITCAGNLIAENIVQVDYVMCQNVVCTSVCDVHTLKYTTLDPPIAPGGVGTLEEVLTAGNDGGGLAMTNLQSVAANALSGSVYTPQLSITNLISGPGIVITSPDNDNLTIPSNITASGKQINARAFVADYEFAVVPGSQTETSNLILGSNNLNNYNLFQYNPVGGTNNVLQLQYQQNSIQPSTTKTLLNILPAGDIQLGYSTSESPIVQISGSTGLGRIYDAIYNPPSGIANTLFATGDTFIIGTGDEIRLSTMNTSTLTNPCTAITLDMINFTISGTNTGTNTNGLSLVLYLAKSPTEVYNITVGTNFKIVQASASTPSPFSYTSTEPITLKYYSNGGNINNLYLMATITSIAISAELNINNISYRGLVSGSNSGVNSFITSI